MSILLGQSPQSVFTGTVVYGAMRWGHNAISSVYQDEAATIDYIKIKAKRVGTSGDVTIEVWDTPYTDFAEISGLDDAAAVTIGNLIGSKTVDSSGWSNSAYDSHTFTFASPVELPDHGIFIIAIKHPGGGLSNCIEWAFPTGASYTQVRSTDNGASWTKQTGVTGIYQTYGTVGTAPEQPINPTPEHEDTEVDFTDLTLSWEDGVDNGNDADTYDVWFGDSENLYRISEGQAGLTVVVPYTTEVDEAGTTHAYVDGNEINWNVALYWEVDATNDYGTTEGNIWNFDARPAKVSTVTPTDESTDVNLNTTFTWESPSANTDSYSLYLGTESGNLDLHQSEVIDPLSVLAYFECYNLTYYWAVDAVNDFGITLGDELWFVTIPFYPPRISYRLISGGSGAGPNDDPAGTEGIDWEYTGLNNMITVRKLVVVANNKVWIEDI